MEREFAELGLNIVWHPFWSAKLQEIVDNARSEAAKAGKRFSEDAFVDERRRKETIPGRG